MSFVKYLAALSLRECFVNYKLLGRSKSCYYDPNDRFEF